MPTGTTEAIASDGLDHRQRTVQVTIADLYEQAHHRFASRAAVRDGATTLTYRELGDRVHRIVGGLTELGLRRGERGVLLLGNGAEFFEAEHALFVGGFVRTALSVRLHLREVVHILTDCAAAVVFASPDWAGRLAGVRDQLPSVRHVVTVAGGPGDTTLARLRAAAPAPYQRPLPHDPAAILYTSGTTGRPKGATLSHANWAAMVRDELLELPPGAKNDLVLHVAPLSQLSGYVAPSYFVLGATHLTCPRFDAAATLELVERHRVTILPMVPTMLNLLVLAAEQRAGDYGSLHTVVYAGSPIAPDRLARARQVFGDVFVQFYGLSEVPVPITCLSRQDHAFDAAEGIPRRLASAGRVSPFVEVTLVDEGGRGGTRRRGRLPPHRGPQEGHGGDRRVQRVPDRGRERRVDVALGVRGRRRRRPGPGVGRVAQGRRRGPRRVLADRGGRGRGLCGQPRELQEAALGGVRDRTAQDGVGQDHAPAAAGPVLDHR